MVGIILITTEFRHFTSRPTFLIEPRRGLVIVAKIVVAAFVGVIYGVACAGGDCGDDDSVVRREGDHDRLDQQRRAPVAGGRHLVIAIFAVVGIGLGVLIRNQIAAVIGALVYLFVIEPLVNIVPVIQNVYPYLPGAAASAITGGSRGLGNYTADSARGRLRPARLGIVLRRRRVDLHDPPRRPVRGAASAP